MEFTHSSGTMLKCDRSDYVGIYLGIYLHSFKSPPSDKSWIKCVCIGVIERGLLTFTGERPSWWYPCPWFGFLKQGYVWGVLGLYGELSFTILPILLQRIGTGSPKRLGVWLCKHSNTWLVTWDTEESLVASRKRGAERREGGVGVWDWFSVGIFFF